MRTLRPREVKQPITYLPISFASIRSGFFKIPSGMLTAPFHLPHTQAVQPLLRTCLAIISLSLHSPQSRAPIVIMKFVYEFLPLPTSQPLSQSAFLTGRWHFRWTLENKENFLRVEREKGEVVPGRRNSTCKSMDAQIVDLSLAGPGVQHGSSTG